MTSPRNDHRRKTGRLDISTNGNGKPTRLEDAVRRVPKRKPMTVEALVPMTHEDLDRYVYFLVRAWYESLDHGDEIPQALKLELVRLGRRGWIRYDAVTCTATFLLDG